MASNLKARAEIASRYSTCIVVALIVLLTIFKEDSPLQLLQDDVDVNVNSFKGSRLFSRRCDEIYVVGEGETLHSISDKCGDLFIVENNPHIHDSDDVFPGLVIHITPIPSAAGNNKSLF